MISYLKGTILKKELTYIILLVKDIGYKIYVGFDVLENIGQETENAELYCYHGVREDASDLYGFQDFEQLKFFEILLTVQGIGPKMALAIINRLQIKDIKQAIINKDTLVFGVVPGVGPKVANRIILELNNKISPDDLDTIAGKIDFGETLDALVGLGYKAAEVKQILKNLPKKISDPSEKVKWALKQMDKK
jgi:Holliday junction DNA helicase RuvA